MVLCLTLLGACSKGVLGGITSGPLTVRFVHQPLWGDPRPFHAHLRAFEEANPGVRIVTEAIPNASDVAHQYFLTALEGGADHFDVLIADIVWVPEFARAGWIADLSETFPEELLRRELLAGAVDAVLVDGKVYAVPWYVDTGLLYFRTDLVSRAPRTYQELGEEIRKVRQTHPELQGYLWQGKQYEGLVCNVYEAIWGHGGEAISNGKLALDTPEAAAALGHLRSLLVEGLSPPSVTSAAEEESRRPFQEGRAVFMRNWPYAFLEAQSEGSPVRGKVGFAPLPTQSGALGAGTLGGWQLAVNAHSPPERRRAAARLLAHLTSLDANILMATHYGRNPPRPRAYRDPRLLQASPFMASLLPALERARPRPVTPYYNMLSDVLQSEFSAAVAGLRPPAVALRRAQAQVDRLIGAAQ